MFNWLNERRRRRQKEKQSRSGQSARLAPPGSVTNGDDNTAMLFAQILINEAEEQAPVNRVRVLQASGEYQKSPDVEERPVHASVLPVGGHSSHSSYDSGSSYSSHSSHDCGGSYDSTSSTDSGGW